MAKKKVGRNEPCPCKSGRKYKKCCMNVSIGRQKTLLNPLEIPSKALVTLQEKLEKTKETNVGSQSAFSLLLKIFTMHSFDRLGLGVGLKY